LKVSTGKVVTFTQTFHTRGHGEWGTFEQEVVFPNDLDPALVGELEGMGIEDTCTVHLAHLEKFIHDDSLVIKVPKSHLQGVETLKPGMVFSARLTDRALKGIVTSIDETQAIIDCNLPLFGLKNVMSNVRILDIRELKEEEKNSPFQAKLRTV
jgi:FKBP-type peptidyl-prolyl cis-trans isomerase 2